MSDNLVDDLFSAICAVPLIDPHSHIDPRRPTARSLDDILGYHYYTELAHSAGMSKELLAPTVEPRQRVRVLLEHMDRFDNTVQYSWFLEIARTFLDFEGERLSPSDCDWLCDQAQRLMAHESPEFLMALQIAVMLRAHHRVQIGRAGLDEIVKLVKVPAPVG